MKLVDTRDELSDLQRRLVQILFQVMHIGLGFQGSPLIGGLG